MTGLPSASPLRRIGTTELFVSPVAMGCWPIAGVTTVGVTEAEALATLRAAHAAGVNFFDTAYVYGYRGESEQLIGRALSDVRDEIIIASKCGLHWNAARKQEKDSRPATIFRQCEESLRRLQTDRIDLYYLHAPDPQVPLSESAAALATLLEQGKIRAVGVSNVSCIAELETFASHCPLAAVQLPYNLLQRGIEAEFVPWCRARNVSLIVYWPLMKGFLAGKLSRNHVWDPRDSRQHYPVFSGAEWDKTHDLLEVLRPLAAAAGMTMAQLIIAWTIQRPGITAALCGARRPDQIEETAAAMFQSLTTEQQEHIERAVTARGPVAR